MRTDKTTANSPWFQQPLVIFGYRHPHGATILFVHFASLYVKCYKDTRYVTFFKAALTHYECC